jgi:hypothetical protein
MAKNVGVSGSKYCQFCKNLITFVFEKNANFLRRTLAKIAENRDHNIGRGPISFPLFRCSVHVKLDEKISMTAGRDGGLRSLEVTGMLAIRISDETFGRIKLAMQVSVVHNQ